MYRLPDITLEARKSESGWDELWDGSGADVAVTYPGKGDDDAGFFGVGLKLVSQGGNMPFKRVERAAVIAPNVIQKLLMAQDAVAVELLGCFASK